MTMKNMKKVSRKRSKINFRPLIVFVLMALVIAGTFGVLRILIGRWNVFNITRVTIEGVNDLSPQPIRKLIGQNIFSADLRLLKEQLQEEFPDIECVSAQRRLPSEVFFQLRRRVPVAYVKLLRFYTIDVSSTLIMYPSDFASADLPVITGLSDKIQRPKIGTSYNIAQLEGALALINEKNKNSFLNKYRIAKIDVSRFNEGSFFLAENSPALANQQLEIKFDYRYIKETIKVLGMILQKRRDALVKMEYIDIKNPNSPVFLEKKTDKVN